MMRNIKTSGDDHKRQEKKWLGKDKINFHKGKILFHPGKDKFSCVNCNYHANDFQVILFQKKLSRQASLIYPCQSSSLLGRFLCNVNGV